MTNGESWTTEDLALLAALNAALATLDGENARLCGLDPTAADVRARLIVIYARQKAVYGWASDFQRRL